MLNEGINLDKIDMVQSPNFALVHAHVTRCK